MSQKQAFPTIFVNPTQYNLMGPDGNVVPPLGMVSTPGMTQRAYAAIALKVPASGEEWLDDMIRASRQMDLREQVVAAMLSYPPVTSMEVAYAEDIARRAVNTIYPDPHHD